MTSQPDISETNHETHGVIVHLVRRIQRNTKDGPLYLQTIAYASKDEAETISKLHGVTVETVPVIGAVAFTADELSEIADALREYRVYGPHAASGTYAQELHALEVKAASMALLEVVNQP